MMTTKWSPNLNAVAMAACSIIPILRRRRVAEPLRFIGGITGGSCSGLRQVDHPQKHPPPEYDVASHD